MTEPRRTSLPARIARCLRGLRRSWFWIVVAIAAVAVAVWPEAWSSIGEHPAEAIAVVGLLLAVWQSDSWLREFRFRRDHEIAQEVNAAVTDWIERVRHARRPLRTDAAAEVQEDRFGPLRKDLRWALAAARKADAAFVKAKVLWGHDDPEIAGARLLVQQVCFDLRQAFWDLSEPMDKPYALTEQIDRQKKAREVLFAKMLRVEKGEHSIEARLEKIHAAIEKATRPILRSRR